MKTSCNCPLCGSENTQPASLVVAAGTTNTVGQMLAMDSNIDVEAGGFSATSQTSLAARLDPGPRPSNGIVLAVSVAGLCVFFLCAFPKFLSEGGVPLYLVIGVGVLGILNSVFSWKKYKAWPARAAQFAKQWFCHRCGAVYEPGQS